MKDICFYVVTTISIIFGAVIFIKKSFRFRTGVEATEIEAIIIGSSLIFVGVLGVVLGLKKKK